MHVSCSKCGIQDILEFSKNPDEVFLEFLARFDKGLVTQKELTEELADEGIIRTEKEHNNNNEKTARQKAGKKIFSKKSFLLSPGAPPAPVRLSGQKIFEEKFSPFPQGILKGEY